MPVSYDLTNKGGLSGFTKCPDAFPYRVDLATMVRSKKFDVAKIAAQLKKVTAGWGTPWTTFAINDVYALIPASKGEVVEWVAYLIQTAETVNTTAALAIGDTTVNTGYFTSVALNATGLGISDFSSTFFQASGAATAINKVGKLYTTDDAIAIKLLTAIPTNAVFTISAKVVPLFPEVKANAQ